MTPYNCKEQRRNLVFPPLSVIRCGCLIRWIIVCIVCIVLLHLEDNLILFWGPGQECWDWGWGVVPPGVDVSHTSVCSKWGRVCVLWWCSVKIHTRRSKQESNISLAKKQFWYFCTIKLPEIVKNKVVDLWPIVKFGSAISKFKTRLLLGLGYLMYQRYFWNMNMRISVATPCFPGVLGRASREVSTQSELSATKRFQENFTWIMSASS